jgi:hypothetical protein
MSNEKLKKLENRQVSDDSSSDDESYYQPTYHRPKGCFDRAVDCLWKGAALTKNTAKIVATSNASTRVAGTALMAYGLFLCKIRHIVQKEYLLPVDILQSGGCVAYGVLSIFNILLDKSKLPINATWVDKVVNSKIEALLPVGSIALGVWLSMDTVFSSVEPTKRAWPWSMWS